MDRLIEIRHASKALFLLFQTEKTFDISWIRTRIDVEEYEFDDQWPLNHHHNLKQVFNEPSKASFPFIYVLF